MYQPVFIRVGEIFSGEKRILEYKYSIYLKVNRGYKYGNFSYN